MKHGVELIMRGDLQTHFKHGVPKLLGNVGVRIVITVRYLIYSGNFFELIVNNVADLS